MSNKDRPSADQVATEEEIALVQGPVHVLESDAGRQLDEGPALCLSGGGYRAMLFHTGVLWRLNEIGRLTDIKRISSVSGGSITAALLAVKWGKFNMTHGFEKEVVLPIRKLASHTIDVSSVLKGIFWFGSIGDNVASAYRRFLFGNSTLQDIPSDRRYLCSMRQTYRPGSFGALPSRICGITALERSKIPMLSSPLR